MSYIPTTWLEHSMTGNQKLTALNNCEQQYTQSCAYVDSILHGERYYTKTEIGNLFYDTSYIDGILHGERYYTKAQAAAKYFTSANDGSGSGLICSTLDGYTAQQILDAGFPSGGICGWAGSEASIPDGFSLCNGGGGAPNLLGRILVAAGDHYSRGNTGGANTVTTAATVTIAGHALTAAEIPLHDHGAITDSWGPTGVCYGTSSTYVYPYGAPTDFDRYTGYVGSGSAHDHTATFAGSAGQDKRPSFMALCLICKS